MRTRARAPWASSGTQPMSAVLAVVLLAAAGCGASNDPAENSVDPPATSEMTATEEFEVPVTETTSIVYMTVDGADLLMDVFAPEGEGPWPVVVSFHGCCGDPEGKDIPPTVSVAEAAAAQGMLVFTPTWLRFDDIPLTSATPVEAADRAACAVALAQQLAPEYGGDPTRTVVDGFSAGATAVLGLASDGPRSEPVAGCATNGLPTPATGFVLGDVESWLHTEFFDGAFAEDAASMQGIIASYLDPASWQLGPDAEVYVWATEGDAQPRQIGDLVDDAGWFAQRDPDGSIQADLERLGQLSDGTVDYRDAVELLYLRLDEAGIDATLDVYPGAHTTLDKVADIVAYFESAASSS